ncbi:MAG: HAD family hydrolase [Candidatus Cloacimonadaceae bacterium]|nr:HAD family hydrolase [Candidatus Cloacimonadaceae bacterium]
MEKKPRIKALIFDLDGTLLDTLTDIASSMNKALVTLKLPVHPVEAYKGFVGNGLQDMVKQVLPKSNQTKKHVEEATELFWKYYDINWRDNTKVYPGILYLIKLCLSRKIKLAILSNKPHFYTKQMIRYFFRGALVNYHKNPFGIYSGEQKDKQLKPDPAVALELAERLKAKPEEIVFIGDMAIDIETAKRAGMISFGAAWGYRGKEELSKADADMVFDSAADIAHYIETIPACL